MARKAKENKYENYVPKFSHASDRKTNIQIKLQKKLDEYQVNVQFLHHPEPHLSVFVEVVTIQNLQYSVKTLTLLVKIFLFKEDILSKRNVF